MSTTTTPTTLMFVDDDEDLLLAHRIVFEAQGYRVLTATSPDDALELLETERPELIVLDLMMDHHDSGFTLSHRIRRGLGMSDVPLIMLSGVASATGKRFGDDPEGLARWTGIDTFLDKPVAAEQLLRVVRERLAQKGDAAATAS